MNIGRFNTLTIARTSDYGLYLSDDNGLEVLLPTRYVTTDMQVGNKLEVFIYRDSEDRPVATTERPNATVNQFAFLQVKSVNKVGAFLDWGLPKDLLVPFREQKLPMQAGRWYMVYVYLDDNTGRLAASARLDKFLDNVPANFRAGNVVDIQVWQRTDLGYKVIVNNLHSGMIYHNEIHAEINIGEHHKARIKTVRADGKLNLTLGGNSAERSTDTVSKILSIMNEADGRLYLTDKSSPEDIAELLQCSKKDFKKAVGALLKQGKINLAPDHIALRL